MIDFGPNRKYSLEEWAALVYGMPPERARRQREETPQVTSPHPPTSPDWREQAE